MGSWTKRERGLGLGLALVTVAAVAVPAWADNGENGAGGRPPAALSVSPSGAPPEGAGFPALPSAEQRRELERCLSEQGIDTPAPGERPSPPDFGKDGDFGRAADECGLPTPPPPGGRAGLEGHKGELCAPPAPPPLRQR
jgi:hypothetical protein